MSNSDTGFPGPANHSCELTLRIRGRGHVPSFKNRKRIAAGRRLITDPRIRRWMETAIADFESQLSSLYRIGGGGTWTASRARSWIASCVPADDSWREVSELMVTAEIVERGAEGATVIITRL